MSRLLVSLAGLLFGIAALAPIVAMYLRVGAEDLANLLEPRTWSLLGRTAVLGGSVAGISLLVGVPFGFLVARTDVPGARSARLLGILPIFVPTLLLAMTFEALNDTRGAPMAIWVLALANFPLVAIFTSRAAERIDGRLEEVARTSGGWRALLRTDFALVLPSALCGACLAFTFAVNDFAVPDYVSSVGPKFNVYADEIYSKWNQFKRPGLAAATAIPLIALTLGSLVPALALRRRGSLRTLGEGFRSPTPLALGRWRWPLGLFVWAVVGAAALLPLGRLLWEAGSGPQRWHPIAVQAQLAGEELPTPKEITERAEAEPVEELGLGTLLGAAPTVLAGQAGQIRTAFGEAIDRARDDLRRSVTYSFGAATLALLLGLVLGHAIERARRGWIARSIELAALLPLAAPATLFGIGAIVIWSRPAFADFYASEWIAPLLFTGRLATFAILILSGACASLSPRLEEAAATSGAGPIRRLFGIVAPNLSGSLAGAWVLVFGFAMKELDAGILVPAANRTAIVRVFQGVHFSRDAAVAALALLLVLTILLPGLLWLVFGRRPSGAQR